MALEAGLDPLDTRVPVELVATDDTQDWYFTFLPGVRLYAGRITAEDAVRNGQRGLKLLGRYVHIRDTRARARQLMEDIFGGDAWAGQYLALPAIDGVNWRELTL